MAAWLDLKITGLLHLPSGELLPATPTFFTRNALDFEFDPEACVTDQWARFLHDLWPDDPEAIDTLQEMFGYMLTPDTSYQKIFLLVGPKRSGKGTIARVLTHLVGKRNVAGPTLAGIASHFGLEPLIGAQLAIIADAQLGKRTDAALVGERLLSISGEDTITLDRKYKAAWSGKLAARFLILTNELPRLADASGALASRFIVLHMTESFYGKENRRLLNDLLTELPGILNWAIAGWRRLNERGHFKVPESSEEVMRQLEDLASPITAFVRDQCALGGTVRQTRADLEIPVICSPHAAS